MDVLLKKSAGKGGLYLAVSDDDVDFLISIQTIYEYVSKRYAQPYNFWSKNVNSNKSWILAIGHLRDGNMGALTAWQGGAAVGAPATSGGDVAALPTR